MTKLMSVVIAATLALASATAFAQGKSPDVQKATPATPATPAIPAPGGAATPATPATAATPAAPTKGPDAKQGKGQAKGQTK